MFEIVHDETFLEELRRFTSTLPRHIQEDFQDSIEFPISRNPTQPLFFDLGNNHRVWVRSDMVGVPRCYIIFQVDADNETVTLERLATFGDFLDFLIGTK